MASPPSNDSSVTELLDHFRYKTGRDSPSDVRNVLLVVAALTAAATFAAGVNPPGGVWQDNNFNTADPDYHIAGKAVLASSNKVAFTLFLFANSAAFSASTTVISFLVHRFPFYVEIYIGMFGMGFTYGVSTASISPPGDVAFYYVLTNFALALPYIIRYGVVEPIKKRRRKSDNITQN